MIMPDVMTSTYEDGGRVGRDGCARRPAPEALDARGGRLGSSRETYLAGHSVSLVARRHGIAANQLFAWRRLMAQGALTAAGAGEEVVRASQYRALEGQVRELQRLLGKKTMENEVLREAVTRAAGPKKLLLRSSSWPEGRTVSALRRLRPVVSRPHLSATLHAGPRRRRGRPPQPDDELVAAIGALIADLPT